MKSSSVAYRHVFSAARPALPFRSVNRRGSTQYDPNLQRHHLLPLQLLNQNCFGYMFEMIGRKNVGFDDFRANGLMLPSRESTAIRLCLPLHRGPHRAYNEMVIARVGRIEHQFIQKEAKDSNQAAIDALVSLALLQKALKRQLLDQQRRIMLNRNDPVGTGYDFAELDAMADSLWEAK